MKTKLLTTALLAMFALTMAPSSASAQGFNLAFGKHKRGKFFGLNVNVGGRRHHHRHVHSSCCRHWQPGRVEVVQERVWVPGSCQRVWVAPVYETRYDRCGNAIQILVRAGHYNTVQTPGRYECRPRTIRHPGRWVYTCGH